MSTGSTYIVTLFLVVLGLFMRWKGILDWIFFFSSSQGPWLNGAVSAERTDVSPVRNDEVQQITKLSSIYLPRFTFLNSSVTFQWRLSDLVRELFAASLSPSATAPAWHQLSVMVLARDQQCTLVMRPVTCMCPWVTHRSGCAESGHFCFIGGVGWGGSNNV